MSPLAQAFDTVRWTLFNHDVGRSYYRLPAPYLERRWLLLGMDGKPPITPLGLQSAAVEARGFGFHGWCLTATRCLIVLAELLGNDSELAYAKAEVDVKIQTKSQLGARMVHYWCENDGVRIDPTWEQTVIFPNIVDGGAIPEPRGATQWAHVQVRTPRSWVPITSVEASLLRVATTKLGLPMEVQRR